MSKIRYALALAFLVTGCATTDPYGYELCNESGCGDNVVVIFVDE